MESYIQLKVATISDELPGIRTFQLIPLSHPHLSYKAGQFLTFLFNIRDKEIRRSFSISSSPCIGEPVAITFKRIANGEISNYLYYHVHVNDVLTAALPAGLFTLRQPFNSNQTLFFIAAGIGITPVLPVMECALIEEPMVQCVLIYCNTNRQGVLFYSKIERLQERFPRRLKWIQIYSRPTHAGRYIQGHLNLELLRRLIVRNNSSAFHDTEFYICGPFAFMRMAQMIIIAMGYDKAQLHKENFVVPEKRNDVELMPVKDKSDKKIIIRHKAGNLEFMAHYSESILDAALRQNIALPYSCRGGICSSCMLKCTHGQVWMSINDILTPKELAAGYVLTCTGYAVSESVMLEG